MAKREIKAVAVLADVAAIIDRGADVDAQIKNLGFEDKGLKTKITEAGQNQLEGEELSVRLLGSKSAAVVSGSEKIDLDANAEQFPKVRKALDKGFLQGAVDRIRTLVVPPGEVDNAVAALNLAGVTATVTETLKISPDAWRHLKETRSTSIELAEAEEALLKCVRRDVSFRVKYERI